MLSVPSHSKTKKGKAEKRSSSKLNYSIDNILSTNDSDLLFNKVRDSGCKNPYLQPKVTADNKVKLEPINVPPPTLRKSEETKIGSEIKTKAARKEMVNSQPVGKSLPVIREDKIRASSFQSNR